MVNRTSDVDVDFFHDRATLSSRTCSIAESDIASLMDEYNHLFESLVADWHAQGIIRSTYAELPFAQRWARVLTETGAPSFQPLDISLPSKGVTSTTPMHAGPAVFAMLTNARLLDIVEQFVGPEILSNPIQHVRIKPPEHLSQIGSVPRCSPARRGTRIREWRCPRSTTPRC